MPEALALPTPADAIDRARRDMPALPPYPFDGRWTPTRKMWVVIAIRSARLRLEEACAAYDVPVAELRAWDDAFRRNGLAGLCSTKIQQVQQRPRQAYAWRRRA